MAKWKCVKATKGINMIQVGRVIEATEQSGILIVQETFRTAGGNILFEKGEVFPKTGHFWSWEEVK